MHKVYCLVNKNKDKIIAGSKTRVRLEEIVCDMFMEDFQKEMQELTDAEWFNPENPAVNVVETVWSDTLYWNKRNYEIQKVWLE